MSLDKLHLYWQTLRHLRPVQFYGRAWFRLRRPKVDLRPAPSLRNHRGDWTPCQRSVSMVAPNTFSFLSVEHELISTEDWNRKDWPKLWLYNLHYFDDLVAYAAVSRRSWHRSLINRWITENPPGRGNGWEPYPSSLRIVNWIKWTLSGNPLDNRILESLTAQVRFLRGRLERHLLGNHLWANAKALVFAGMFFEGTEADGWRSKGLSLLHRELTEQILPDGGHFERSPMYHAILLEDILDLIQLAAIFANELVIKEVDNWRYSVKPMLRWLQIMSHPDGDIAFFNDAAVGIAPNNSALTRYADNLGMAYDEIPLAEIEALPDSGYVRLQSGPAVLIADVAPIGPDYIPGHAHADTLSFELSLRGQRLLVNGGTSTYEANSERQRQRGTAMHNTVLVDDTNSSETWGSFRVARRAAPSCVHWEDIDGVLCLEAEHDGYSRLPGRVTHHRRWVLREDGLKVVDKLVGKFTNAEARYRFVPGTTVDGNGESKGVIEANGLALGWRSDQDLSASIEPGQWHPRFGSAEPCQVMALPINGDELTTEFLWS